MANPQKENGFTAIANEIIEHLAKIKLTDYEARILHSLWRKTYGFNKKSDVISLSQWSESTKIDTHNVPRTLRLLASRNLILITHLSPRTVRYQFQKNYELWDKSFEFEELFKEQIVEPQESPTTSDEILSNQIVSTEIVSNTILSAKSSDTIQPDTQILSNQIDTKENIQNTYTKENNIYTIFNFWNEKKIKVHRHLNGTESPLKTALKTYSVDEIKQSIENYAEVLKHPELYYFSYKWDLKDFLKRGLDKFLDREVAIQNYSRKKDGKVLKGENNERISPGNPWGNRN